jgi:hypothetical protein
MKIGHLIAVVVTPKMIVRPSGRNIGARSALNTGFGSLLPPIAPVLADARATATTPTAATWRMTHDTDSVSGQQRKA